MKTTIFCSLILFVIQLSNFVLGAIPTEERAALIAFYIATDGDNWDYKEGWKTPPLFTDGFALPGTEGHWEGIEVSGDHVIILCHGGRSTKGSIPPELGNLKNLEKLQLDFSQLSGSIPPQLGNLSLLTMLDLGDNQLSGGIPPELGNLSNLRILNLQYNRLSGNIPPVLENLKNLQRLALNRNRLSGGIPPQLGNLSKLQNLYLDENQLSGSIPPQLGNLSKLEYLYLDENQLSGSIPTELGNLSSLKDLILNHNQLSGSIPPELGNLSKMEYLFLHENQLSGSIPPELGNFSHLESLNLKSNQFSGSIPPELGNLSKLANLDLGDNRLRESIPPELGNLICLQALVLIDNRLSGSIPTELGNLPNLRRLSLSQNNLSGEIPSSLIHLPKLRYFDIGYNCLVAGDTEVRSWLNLYVPDWQATQCLEKNPPFGDFATPISGVTVSGSIAITGWALDDYGMDSVKLYREQENALICIGDAIFIEGARPDIEIAYPGYPGNKKAGWGYMLLTNLLPNNGNGTFVIYTIAMDKFGKTTTLGTKTIIADNVSAVKPFGAIDTPTQGGTASGKGFVNFGWALTPQPNSIPVNGSTINVVIDGVVKGHPIYNNARSDIANLFPGYANSDGAGGGYYIDTTKLENGLHTIAWIVTDNAGNSDGIGSRYFTVQNLTNSMVQEKDNKGNTRSVIKSFDQTFSKVWPPAGSFIEIQELERVEINLSAEEVYDGYLVVGDQLRELPIGSTLDKDRGIFYWQPGPGFVGEYHFVFIEKDNSGQFTRQDIVVNIKPMHIGIDEQDKNIKK